MMSYLQYIFQTAEVWRFAKTLKFAAMQRQLVNVIVPLERALLLAMLQRKKPPDAFAEMVLSEGVEYALEHAKHVIAME